MYGESVQNVFTVADERSYRKDLLFAQKVFKNTLLKYTVLK